MSLVAHLPDELVTAALNVDDPRHLVYLVATNLRMDPEERQQLLELDSVRDKLAALNTFIAKELDVLELGKKIQSDVQEELGKNQREYYLREQMKAIQRELGEGSETEAEATELRQKIEESGMPEEAAKEARRELDRLSKLPPAAAEYGVIKTYLDWLTYPALELENRRRDRHRQGAPDPGRRALRPREDQGPHPRVPGGAQAEARGRGRGRRAGASAVARADPLLRRSSRRRQDESGAIDRARPWPRADPDVARRSPRRGRDSRPPPHLRWRHAGADHPSDPARRFERPRLRSGRG